MERGEIEESLRHISGRTSVYYRNLVTGATIGIREKLPMMAASVIKISTRFGRANIQRMRYMCCRREIKGPPAAV